MLTRDLYTKIQLKKYAGNFTNLFFKGSRHQSPQFHQTVVDTISASLFDNLNVTERIATQFHVVQLLSEIHYEILTINSQWRYTYPTPLFPGDNLGRVRAVWK